MNGGRPQAAELRRKAERRLRTRKASPTEAVSEIDSRAMVHELQVHQIELEMQNEELQLAEAVAKEASEKYYDLFDFAPIRYFLWDHDAQILEVNLAGAALLGFDRKAVIHKRFGQFLAMEQRAAFANFCKRVLTTGTQQTCEVKILRDGQSVNVLVEGIAAADHLGKRSVCRAAVIDITQQKRADELATTNQALQAEIAARKQSEEALRESEAKFRAAFENAPFEFWVRDAEGRRIMQNAAFTKHWGEQIGKRVVDADIPVDVAAVWQANDRRAYAGEVIEGDVEYAYDGEKHFYHNVVAPFRVDGEVRGILGFNIDIMERKRAEEALRESEAKYRALFDQAADAIVVLDPKTLSIVDFNDEAYRRLGYTREEFGKLTIPDIDLIDSAEEVNHRMQEIIASGSEIFETKHRTKSGIVLDVEIRAKAVGLDGGAIVQGIWRDITAQKRAEEALKTVNETLEQCVAERTEAIQMLHDVASMANQSQSAKHAIEHCLQRLATFNGWGFGHALLLAADNPDELVPAYIYYPEVDSDHLRRFREVTLGMRFHRGQCLPGRVFASGKPEWTTDVRHDLSECRAVVAKELGIGAAISFPVLVGEKVVAVLEFFANQVLQPDARTTDVMADVGMQVGRVVERAKFEEHLLTIAEEIRQGLSQDLHDDVGQELTGLGLKAQTLAEMLGTAKSRAGELAADIVAALERTHDKVRSLCRRMLPIELEEGLLFSALEQLAVATSRSSRIKCKFARSHPDPVFDRHVCVHLYRIAQEAVANALRHSGAQRLHITIDQEHGETALRIEDDGKGFSVKPIQTEGMGLRTMRYRAGLIGGKLEIGPGIYGGTQVVCWVPPTPPHAVMRKSSSDRRQSG